MVGDTDSAGFAGYSDPMLYIDSCRIGSAGRVYYHYAVILHYSHAVRIGASEAVVGVASQARELTPFP